MESFAHHRAADPHIGCEGSFARQHVTDLETVGTNVFPHRLRGGLDHCAF